MSSTRRGSTVCALTIGAGDPAGSPPTERKRAVAVAGACPDTQGVPLTRWSLDRLSAYLAEHGLVIYPIHLWRLLAEAGLSFQRTRSWKASPDPDYEAKAARVLELYDAAAVRRAGDQLRPDGTDQPQTHPGRRLGAAQAPRAAARDLQPQARDPLHLRRAGRPPRPALRPNATPPRRQRRPRVHAHDPRLATRPGSGSTGSKTTSRPTGPPTSATFAATNKIELVPTPTYASYLNWIESHFHPIQEFVFNNTDYRDWETAQRAVADYITHRNGADRDRRIAALERKHRIAA